MQHHHTSLVSHCGNLGVHTVAAMWLHTVHTVAAMWLLSPFKQLAVSNYFDFELSFKFYVIICIFSTPSHHHSLTRYPILLICLLSYCPFPSSQNASFIRVEALGNFLHHPAFRPVTKMSECCIHGVLTWMHVGKCHSEDAKVASLWIPKV